MNTKVQQPSEPGPPRLVRQWAILGLALLVFSLIAVYITQEQHQLNQEKAAQTAADRFQLLATLVTTSLESGNFEKIQPVFEQWGSQEPELFSLTLHTRNGYELGKYQRELIPEHTHSLSREIEYGYRGAAKLTMVSDMDWVHGQLQRLILQMLGAVLLVGMLGAYFIRGMARRQQRSNQFQRIGRQLAETNAELDQERTLLRSLIDSIPDLIYFKNKDGRYLGCNKAYSRYSGRSCQQHLNQTDLDLYEVDKAELLQRKDSVIISSGIASRTEEWVEYPDGTRVLLDILRTPFSGPENHELQGMIGIGRDITELKHTQSELQELAYHDSLTRLPNRRYLVDRMQHDTSLALRQDTLLAVCALDIDGFKPINDRLGHSAGDKMLIEFADRLKKVLRSEDTLARWGGDEFTILICGLKEENECALLLDRIKQEIIQPFSVEDHPVQMTASIGVTLYPLDRSDAETLLRHADQAMYQAKQHGKNQYVIFDSEKDRSIHSHMEGIARIAKAIRDNELCLHYQPQVQMRTGQVQGVEALVRWQHPHRGLLQPVEFLPLVQGHDISVSLDWWVLEAGLRQLSEWQMAGIPLLMSVNLSALTLQQLDFIPRLERLLAANPSVPAEKLQLEILETTSLEDLDQVFSIMQECAGLGVSFALDDFGTGYSSLTYLRRLPAQVLKIDQSFVRDMLVDEDDLHIVEGVIQLARTFNRDLIAEGVESIEHGVHLIRLGCHQAQGYGIARPMPAAKLPAWLQTYRAPREWMLMAVGA